MLTLVCFDTKVGPVVGYGASDVVYVQVWALPGIPTRDQSLCKGPKGLEPPAVPPVPPCTFKVIVCGYFSRLWPLLESGARFEFLCRKLEFSHVGIVQKVVKVKKSPRLKKNSINTLVLCPGIIVGCADTRLL